MKLPTVAVSGGGSREGKLFLFWYPAAMNQLPARACCLILLALLATTGCQRKGRKMSAPLPSSPTGVESDQDASAQFDRIVDRLWDADESVREAGLKELTEFRKDTKAPGSQVGLKALRAAARPYRFEKPDAGSVSFQLVDVASSTPRPEYLPVVVELFDRFPDDAKSNALAILTGLESREAAQAFMTVVRTHAPAGKLPSLNVWQLVNKPRHPDVFFPEILKYANDPKLSFEIYRLCLAYCESKLLTPDQLAPSTDGVLKNYQTLADKLRPAQKAEGIGWMWEDAYQDSRNLAGLLLDLLGYFPAGKVEKTLREALEYRDPRLKHFAVVSLLRHGKPVDKRHVEDVARSAEMRNWIYQALTEFGKVGDFPERYRTQKAFAESDMVHWLVYPTELGRVPDEIELMKVVPVDTGLKDGIYDYYLFRFRTKEPHWAAKDGWIAGISGPYLRKDQPTTQALGDTFSTFTKWGDKTPDEHVGDVRELMEKWRKYHAGQKD